MYRRQTDQNIAEILLFLDNLLIFYQAFGVKLSLTDMVCLLLAGPAHLLIGTALLLGLIWYI